MNKTLKKKSIKRELLNFGIAFAVTAVMIVGMYFVCVYSNIPFIKYWREIWIETAMTTGDHQWLATLVIPENIINDVMENQLPSAGTTGGEQYLDADSSDGKDEEEVVEDILNQKNLKIGDLDYAGYKVLVNDIEQGIVISEITGSGYKGKIMLIDDPSRVFVGTTPNKYTEGLRIKDMLEYYDAVAGINASGFSDPGGEGNGGDIIGMSCSQGEFWGTYVNYYGSVVMTESNRLVVGNISIWQDFAIRDGIQFGPVLIADGEKYAQGSNGYGIQPRTAIGQREDGVIALLVIDGRNVLHSIGCTVGELADILLKYDIINASCCDGGSSSILAYDGEVITKNSSLNPAYGRRLPNAFLVAKK